MARLLERVDAYQRTHRWAGLPFAVVVKFIEDQAGNLAALIAYYAFLSIFPLLLVLTTILGFVLASSPELADVVLNSALGQFPIIGQQSSLDPLTGSPLALVVGVLLASWSGMAVARTAQTAVNSVYAVPRTDWPGVAPRVARSAELVSVGGFGLIVTTLLQGVVSGTAQYGLSIGLAGEVLAAVLGVGLNFLLFSYLFRRLTVLSLRTRDVAPGALLAALAWFVLQKVGTGLVNSKISGAEGTYGTFAVVIGLLFWFFLLAQVTLVCVEINVVLTQRLWPRGLRSLSGEASTRADARAYSTYTRREQHARNVDVTTHYMPPEPPSRASGNGTEPGSTETAEQTPPAAPDVSPEPISEDDTQPLKLRELHKPDTE